MLKDGPDHRGSMEGESVRIVFPIIEFVNENNYCGGLSNYINKIAKKMNHPGRLRRGGSLLKKILSISEDEKFLLGERAYGVLESKFGKKAYKKLLDVYKEIIVQ